MKHCKECRYFGHANKVCYVNPPVLYRVTKEFGAAAGGGVCGECRDGFITMTLSTGHVNHYRCAHCNGTGQRTNQDGGGVCAEKIADILMTSGSGEKADEYKWMRPEVTDHTLACRRFKEDKS